MGAEEREERAQRRLGRLRRRIERWRWTRRARGPMPAKLWAEAIDLGRELGAYRVAGDLGIGYQSLRGRLVDDDVAEPRRAQEFIELNTGVLFAPPPATTRGEVELSDGSGVKLVIRLGAGESVDLAAVVAAFRAVVR